MTFLASLVHAQVSVDEFYQMENFSGGLKSHISPFLVDKSSAQDALNVRFNEQFGALSKRAKMSQLSRCDEFPVKSLHRFYRSDGLKFTIQTSSDNIYLINDIDGSCTEAASGLSDGRKWQWVTYKDVAIGTNGSNIPVKFDGLTTTTANTTGARTAGSLFANLGAPFAKLNTGSNLTSERWYQYKVAFYDGANYLYSESRSNPILTGSTVRDIRLTDIPLGPAGTTQRIIYRTSGQTSLSNVLATTSFFRVATISDNSTREFNDTVTDATLAGDSAPTWATVSAGSDVTPPLARLAVIHKERLFLANDPSGLEAGGRSTLFWSDQLNPDVFYPEDYDLVRPDDGDEITFIKNIYGILTIGKTNTIQKFYTEAIDTEAWVLSNPFSFIGCVAPYSAVNTPQGVFYVGRHGIYLFNGQSSSLISDVVTDVFRDMLETNFQDMNAIFHDNQYHLAYTSKSSGAATNDHVLVLDTVRDAYVKDRKSVESFVAFDSGTDFGTLYSGSSDGRVFAHTVSFNEFIYRYKSQLDGGEFTATQTSGPETFPVLSLGWDKAWNEMGTTTWEDLTSSTWLVQNSTGTWVSPIVQIDVVALDKIFWNHILGDSGNVTFAVRTAATSAGITGASWSSEFTNQAGSDLSGVTPNNFIQIRATLTTSDITKTPYVFFENSYVIKLVYTKEGVADEPAFLSFYQTGFTPFGGTQRPKRIKEIQVFYSGTEGSLNIEYRNAQGNFSDTFTIDLSIDPTSSKTDQYYGTVDEKVYVYTPSVRISPVGRHWQFRVTETGKESWRINRIVVRYDVNEYVPMR
jgi:hypothetical protein